jgi:hypothetical protein
MARYILEENKTRHQIELKNTVIIPGFEKNIVSMLRLHDEGYEFNINSERCLITKQDDERVRIELRPGPKGAYYLQGKTIPKQGGRSTKESAFPLEEDIWHDVSSVESAASKHPKQNSYATCSLQLSDNNPQMPMACQIVSRKEVGPVPEYPYIP